MEQIAIVTGAAGGFGSAICHVLLEANYKVVATDLHADKLAELERHLASPEKLITLPMDVTNIKQIKEVQRHLVGLTDSAITVLVNNAGLLEPAFCLKEESPAIAQKTFDINLQGAFNCTTVFSQSMVRQRYGRIINIGSVAGIWGAGGAAAYAASKAGLIKASESWANELGPMNICVTCVAPGICKTPMYDKLLEQEGLSTSKEEEYAKLVVPSGRFGTPEDVAEVVGFLATCRTNYINSAVIELDGGMRIGTLR
jgi:3-oxoacyl-[acyl-carrier protein] reductase